MAVTSVIRGWECDCGINRNTVNEVWSDCACKKQYTENQIKQSNDEYWKSFWNK